MMLINASVCVTWIVCTHLDCLLGLRWTGLTLLKGFFIFSYFFFFFILGRAVG